MKLIPYIISYILNIIWLLMLIYTIYLFTGSCHQQPKHSPNPDKAGQAYA